MQQRRSGRGGIVQRIVLAQEGNLYLTGTHNSLIRKVTPAGVVSTVAGNLHTSQSIDGLWVDELT